MLKDEIKNIPSGEKDIRSFGRVMAIAFSFFALLFWWRHKHEALIPPLFITASIFFILGQFIPNLLRPIQKAWMILALMMGWVMTRFICVLLFYLAITPISLLSRLFGKKFMEPGEYINSDSYWIPRKNSQKKPEHYEVQY